MLAVTDFFIWDMGKLEVKTDFMSSVDPDEPEVRLYDYLGNTFGGNDVALETEDIFRRDVLTAMRGFARNAEVLDVVDSVLSLTEIID